jgi:hypothetical protein
MKKIKSIFWIVLFIICFAITFFYVDGYMKNTALGIRADTKIFNKFYEIERDTLDAIFIGNSHVIYNINPVIIWHEQGIPSYAFAMGRQPLLNSYYNIKETLAWQNPKVIVLETYACVFSGGGAGDMPGWVWNTYGLQFSQNKIDAIYATTGGNPGKMLELFLGWPIYHSLNDMVKGGFADEFRMTGPYMNGYYFTKGIQAITKLETTQITETKQLEKINMDYLLKIIKLVKEENIELLLITAPYELTAEEQKIFNSVAIIARQNNVRYIDYSALCDELGINFETDFCDIGHLNYRGAAKLSKHLGHYLHDVYRLENRREDLAYASWNIWADEGMKVLESIE